MKILKVLFCAWFITLISACSSTIDTSPVSFVVSADSPEEVKEAIIESGQYRGWKMKESNDGVIIGYINVKGQIANIQITYTKNSVIIMYLSNENNTAPKRYTRWINNLKQDIQRKL